MAKFFTPTRLSENIAETPEGYLLCLGVPIARTGWQVYAEGETPLETGPDGTVRIHRDWKEVSRPQTIASLQAKSLTIRHPENFVGPKNWQELTNGLLQNVRASEEKDEDGENFLLSDILVTSDMAIQLVKNGLREVSVGYEAEYEQTGEGEGRQFNIVCNHCALVDEGRAGPAYAINDHKGKVNEMSAKLIEKLKAKLGARVVDEAMAEEKPAEKSKDESAQSYDELVKAVKDMSEKLDAMGTKSKDEEKPGEKGGTPDPKEKKAGDEGETEGAGEASLSDRLKALETAVAKLLEGKTGDEDEDGEGEESEDDDFDESEMTGDTAARVEILSPGLKAAKGADVRVKAIESAYATKDGKAVIDLFTGGKAPVLDSAEKIATVFVAASEMLKAQRGSGLARTKDVKRGQALAKAMDGESSVEPVTADQMNEKNAEFYGRK